MKLKFITKFIGINSLALGLIILISLWVSESRNNRHKEDIKDSFNGALDTIIVGTRGTKYYYLTNGTCIVDEFFPYGVEKLVSKNDTLIKCANSNIVHIIKCNGDIDSFEITPY